MSQTKTNDYGGRAIYVIDGCRTPFIKSRAGPGPLRAVDLAHLAGRTLLARQPFAPDALDEVILGCVMPGPDEANIARVAALRLGCGHKVPAWTVQRNCASGMQALDSAARSIACGRSDLVLAGGVEAMSHAPLLLRPEMVRWLTEWSMAKTFKARLQVLRALRPRNFQPIIALLRGLTDPTVGLSMGQTAELIAHRFGITRQDMDEYACASHQRLVGAQDAGRLRASPDGEVALIYDWAGHYYDHDTGVRPDTTVDSLAKLRPVFDRPIGKVTAGNSAQVTDGAAWLILASEFAVTRHGLPVLGRIVDSEWAGLDPAHMGLGPVHAMTPLLTRAGYGVDDIDYWEINEAFAGQVLSCLAAWGDDEYCRESLGLKGAFGTIPKGRLNVDGGGVSLGHPVGASGARIVLHVLRLLEENDAKRGVASLCIGGGQGGAMLVERNS